MAGKPKRTQILRKTDNVQPDLNPEFSNVPLEAEQPTGSERAFQVVWEVVKTIAFIILAAVIIRAFVVQPFFVQGESMQPNFHEGDYLLVNQLSYRFGKPARGDVIIFKAPPEPDTNYIKRVIGLPGETVQLKDGRVQVINTKHPDGVLLDEPYIEPGLSTKEEAGGTHWDVGANQFFVLGDNREPGKSADSREWGLVPRDNIIGKTSLRVYPIATFGFIKHQSFPNLAFSLFTTVARAAN